MRKLAGCLLLGLFGCGGAQATTIVGLVDYSGDVQSYNAETGAWIDKSTGRYSLEGDLVAHSNGFVYGLRTSGDINIFDPSSNATIGGFNTDFYGNGEPVSV